MWMSFSIQKLSVAVQMASTGDIIQALGLAAAGGRAASEARHGFWEEKA